MNSTQLIAMPMVWEIAIPILVMLGLVLCAFVFAGWLLARDRKREAE